MSKTYTINSTRGTGYRGYTIDGNAPGWSGYSSISGYNGYVGRAYDFYATYMMFNMSSVSGKTITDVKLRITYSMGRGTNFYIGAKANSSTNDWAWSSNAKTYNFASGSGTVDIPMGTTLPTYGYTMGAVSDNVAQNSYIVISNAVLLVTTNENDYSYTLAFNSNSGTGTFNNLTGSNTRTSPSYTFTVPSNYTPSRTGYTFSGWGTSSSATTAAVSPGGNYTVSASGTTTLYAVWTKNSYTVSIKALDPESSESNTAAKFDAWYSDDATVLTDRTSLTVTKLYGDTIYINNVRPYYDYNNISSIDDMVSDGNGQYHYTLDETSDNKSLIIHTARNQYTVAYNANGGNNAPENQTKYGGVSITLSNSIPTRDGYTFQTWNTQDDGQGTDYAPSATYTANAAVTLYAQWIASSSTLTLSNQECEAGEAVSIYINKLTPDATHTLTYAIGNQNGTIVTKTSSDNVSWTVPLSVVSQIPEEGGPCYIYCTTYINNVQTGVPQGVMLVVTVPGTYQPSVSLTVVKVNSNQTVASWNILLQGYSQVQLTATATMASGATLVSYSFAGPDVSYLGPNNQVTSEVLTGYGKDPWTVTVTDSRGRTATATWDFADFEIYQYEMPTITGATTQRTDSTGVAAVGPFLKSKANLNISPANGHNAFSIHKVEYRESGAQSWILGDDTMATRTWTSPYGSGTIDPVLSYDIRFTLTDSLGNSAQLVTSLSGIKGIGIGLKNDRIRLGGLPTKPGLQVDWPTEFNGAVTFTGNVDIGDEYGSNADGSYQKFANGTLICWKQMTFSNVAITHSWGSIYDSAWLTLGNWPEEFISAPAVYATHKYESSGIATILVGMSDVTATSAGKMIVWRPTPATASTATYDIVGIGRWK